MDSRRTDPGKQHKPVDAFRDALTVELSEEELSIVSGGRVMSACVRAAHIKEAVITAPMKTG
jgi:hypothetical protein